jgi:hypothetical protein
MPEAKDNKIGSRKLRMFDVWENSPNTDRRCVGTATDVSDKELHISITETEEEHPKMYYLQRK